MKEEELKDKLKKLNFTKEEEFQMELINEQTILFRKIFGEMRRKFG